MFAWTFLNVYMWFSGHFWSVCIGRFSEGIAIWYFQHCYISPVHRAKVTLLLVFLSEMSSLIKKLTEEENNISLCILRIPWICHLHYCERQEVQLTINERVKLTLEKVL